MLLIRSSSLLTVALAASFATLGAAPAWAQGTGTVRGKVTDKATGRPLTRADIVVVGTTQGGSTDATGNYVVSGLPAGRHAIRAMRIGFTRVETAVTVTPGQEVTTDFAMSPTAIQLDEVVVTGTPGATEKRQLGNAVTALKVADLVEEAPVRRVEDVLLARTPGLTLTSYSGQAGAGTNIKIRGAGSLAAGYAPVFYIDGIRFESRNQAGFGTGNGLVQGSSPMDFINPNDIESIEVIKGPAAATLYGADAASGVIQIITKKGRKVGGGVQWTVGAEGGQTDWTDNIGFPTNYWLCSPAQIRTPANFPGCAGMDSLAPAAQRLRVDVPLKDPRLTDALGNTLRQPCNPGCTLRTGPTYKADISARGGGDFFSYFLSADKYFEDGVFFNNFERRIGGRGNFDVTASDKLNFSANFAYARTDNRMPLNDNASNGILRNAFRGQAGGPSAPWKLGWRGFSPELSNQYDNQTHSERTTIGLTTNWRPFSWFTNRLVLGLDKQDRNNSEFFTIDTTGKAPWGANQATGQIQHFMPVTHTWTADYAGTANAKLSDKWTSAFSAGIQYNWREQHSTTVFGQGLVANQLNLVGAAALTTSDEGLVSQKSLGFYTQEQVGWRDRLFVTGAVRVDNNSAFGSNLSLVTYPKASVSYVISDESWFHLPTVERLKLRGAWGQAGRAPLPFTADRTVTTSRTTVGGVSSNELTTEGGSFGNQNLKAETGQEIELGFDASLLKDRAGIEFTYYNQHTKDALVQVPDLRSSGFSGSHYDNVGEVFNRGLELLLTATPVYLRNFSWDASLSFSTNHNELVRFGQQPDTARDITFGAFASVQKHKEGYPLGGYWYNDVNRDSTGAPILAGGQVTVDVSKYTFVGPSNPTREASLTNTFTLFGNVRLYALFDYKGGYSMWCAICSIRSRVDQNTFEINNPGADRSSPTTPDSINIKVLKSLQTKTWIQPADFIKLRELSVTYSLPASWSRMFRATRASITLAGRNLGRWTKYKGVGDPEVNFYSTGTIADFNRLDYDAVPPLQYVYAAVRLTF
jgi:TonB-linked SusC/RagA family outer membrane protein